MAQLIFIKKNKPNEQIVTYNCFGEKKMQFSRQNPFLSEFSVTNRQSSLISEETVSLRDN